jgi:hypothetical protein
MGKGADVLIIALGGNDGLRGISPRKPRPYPPPPQILTMIVSPDTIKRPSRRFPSHLKFNALVMMLNGGTSEACQ